MEERELGIIRDTMLGFEEGIFTFTINFDFGIWRQNFGYYVIGWNNKDRETLVGSEYGAEVIMNILEAVGAKTWEELVGKECWVSRNAENVIVSIEAPAYREHKGEFNIQKFTDVSRKNHLKSTDDIFAGMDDKTTDKLYIVCEYYENKDCEMKENYKPILAFSNHKKALSYTNDISSFDYKIIEIPYRK